VRGRRVTSFPSLRTDLRNAGAEVVDEEVVIDDNIIIIIIIIIISSRNPDDLPAFCEAIVREFSGVRFSQGVRDVRHSSQPNRTVVRFGC